ncbi:MAG TPA: hypothetical protein VF230_11640 [Acidimicrobiales bacterium]
MALFVAASVGVGAQPASAHSFDFCSGSGILETSTPTYYVGFGPPVATSYSMYLTIGGCFLGHEPFAFGFLGGSCGLATGTVNWAGHRGTAIWSGGTLEFDGQVEGAFSIAADATFGHSCTTGAWRFSVSGSAILHSGVSSGE